MKCLNCPYKFLSIFSTILRGFRKPYAYQNHRRPLTRSSRGTAGGAGAWRTVWGAWRGTAHHYNDVTMVLIASQIISLTIVYSTVDSDADQREHQSSASLAFVRGIHRGPVNSPHKWPVTRKMFPFNDVIMWKSRGQRREEQCNNEHEEGGI